MGTRNSAPKFRLAASRLGILLAIVAVRAAIAQDATMQEVAVDPPGRVARLSHAEGQVSLGPAGSEDWTHAVLNRPLTSGDRLWLDRDARAELEVGSATLHLDHGTGFRFVQLDDAVMLMSLTEGAASVRVRDLAERERIQVETPNAAVLLRRPGEYQFEVDPGADRTIVRARSGQAEIRGGGRSYGLRANEEGVFTGLEDLRAQIGPVPPRTAFESWAYDRARSEDRAVSSRYVSHDVVGYEDLDDYGEWRHEPAYGYVWRPLYVGHGWAPYRFGRWVWIRPWGWTWIDDARWGFAPFHYGRWLQLRNHWCWVPGPRHLRPVYAPALVGWVGGEYPRFSASPGRDVGWFPLGPHEVYVPAYRHTPRYIRRVNVANTVIADARDISRAGAARDPQRQFRYRANADAVTTAHQDRFTDGRPVGDGRLRVSERDLWRDNPRPTAFTPTRPAAIAPSRPAEQPSLPAPRTVRRDSRAAFPQRPVVEREIRDTRAADDVSRPSPRTSSAHASYAPSSSSPQKPSPTAERSSAREARESPSTRQSQPSSSRASPSSYQQP